MTATVTRRPLLPLDAPYQATRAPLGIAMSALAGAVGFEAGVGGLRTHVTPFQWMDPLNDDVASSTAEVRYIPYRPSPYASTICLCVWYATGYAFGTTAPGVAPTIKMSVLDDATLTPLAGATFDLDSLPTPRAAIRTTDLAASGQTDTSGLLAGREVYGSTPWEGLTITGLAGADAWVKVEATAAQILAVGWVEPVSAEA